MVLHLICALRYYIRSIFHHNHLFKKLFVFVVFKERITDGNAIFIKFLSVKREEFKYHGDSQRQVLPIAVQRLN